MTENLRVSFSPERSGKRVTDVCRKKRGAINLRSREQAGLPPKAKEQGPTQDWEMDIWGRTDSICRDTLL